MEAVKYRNESRNAHRCIGLYTDVHQNYAVRKDLTYTVLCIEVMTQCTRCVWCILCRCLSSYLKEVWGAVVLPDTCRNTKYLSFSQQQNCMNKKSCWESCIFTGNVNRLIRGSAMCLFWTYFFKHHPHSLSFVPHVSP